MDFTPGLTTGEERTLATLPEEEQIEDESYEGIKKRLFDCDLNTPVVKTKKQPVLVYLRIRPKSQLELLNKDPDCLHVSGEQELLAVAPRSSQTYKNKLGARCLQEGTQKFTFTRIFPQLTSQKELFDETLRTTLKDFFDGQNCLLFTYGVTNSGKTYTVTGTPSDPGVLPRSLDVVFNSIDQQQLSSVSVKPKHFSEVIHLSKEEASDMKTHRENTLNLAREMMNPGQLQHQQTMTEGSAVGDETAELVGEHDISSLSTISKASSNFTDIDGGSFAEFQHDESSIELDCADNQQFSIWVSFAEIYNEFIYDLLSEPPAKGKQRTALKISEDRNKNHFIKGLEEIQVSNVEEAMLLLRLGLRHRHVAHTKLNYNSSRSHSIYSIKLIRVVNMDKPTRALVNRISIVDLAGAERSAKTGASGMRIKEASNINNSLLTLGKCIEAMRYNQSKRGAEERVVPFRESKLTRLFQNYFVGSGKGKSLRQGKITMFVNVSNNASVFDETIHVLKFSALTSKVIPTTKVLHSVHLASTSMCPPPTPHQPPTLTTLTATVQEDADAGETKQIDSKDTNGANLCWEMEANLPPLEANTANCINCKLLSNQFAQYKKEAVAKVTELEVKMWEMECNIRMEVSREFAEQLTEIEDKHILELEEQAEEYEEMYEQRFKLLQQSVKKATSRKRRRQDDDDADISDHSLRTEVANLKEKIQELEEELSLEKNRAAAEIHDAMESYESKVVRLNNQLADMAVQMSSNERQFNSERQTFKEQLEEREEEREKFKSQCQENEDVIVQLKQQCSELRREMKVAHSAQCDSVVAQEGEIDKAELLRERDKILKQLSAAERRNADLAQKASDAIAEEEILQARISELTSENATIEAAKCDLISTIEELTAEKTATESTNAELMQEKQSHDHQKETELVAMRAEAERHNQEIHEMEDKMVALREEINSAQVRISELTSENAAMEAVKEDLKAKLDKLVTEKKASENTEKILFHQKEIELGAVRDEAERHSQEMKNKLMALREELDNAQVRISELTSENATMESVKENLEAKLDEVIVEKKASESAKLEEKILTHQKETELVAMRGETERHHQEMEDKLMVLREEFNSAQVRISELTSENATMEAVKEDLEAKLHELVTEKKASEKAKLEEEKTITLQKDTELATLRKTLENRSKNVRELEDKCMTLRGELNSSLAKLAVKQEAMYKLEETKENLEKEVGSLQMELDTKSAETVSLASKVAELKEKDSLYETFRKTLKEYETTLEKQSSYIHEVEEEKDSVHSQNEELQQKITEMERQLAKVSSSRGGLTVRIQELTQALEDSRQLLSQREKELLDSADKCHETMENQMTDLRKQCSSLEQEIASTKEDNKSLQQQIRDKEGELLALARSVGREKTALDNVNHQLEEAMQLAEQKQSQMDAMQGNHQLEVAQLSIKLREVTAELEEVQFACSQHHMIPGSGASSEGGSSRTEATPEEHIYEEPPVEMQHTADREDPVYDTVEGAHFGEPLCRVENKPSKARRSYLRAVEGSRENTNVKEELDQSKPYVPVLERSSQLFEESILDERTKMEIDATPLPLRKKARKLKAKEEKAARKRSIVEVDKENDHQQGSPLTKKIRPQRTRHKPQRYEEETTSLENFTPTSQKSSHKQRSLRQRILGTGKSKKTKGVTVATPEPKENVGSDCIASRTRQRKGVLSKAQISGPLELQDSPHLSGRNAIEIKGSIQLGSRMRPVTNH